MGRKAVDRAGRPGEQALPALGCDNDWLTVAVTCGTGLSTLWESIDPATALPDRFGFTEVRHATSWLLEAVRGDWDRRVQQCDRLVISAGNLLAWLVVDGEPVIAKCSVDHTRFSRLTEADALVAWLDSEGLPVAGPIAVKNWAGLLSHPSIVWRTLGA